MGLNIAFLIGAGVSIPAGLPSTEELTEKILAGRELDKYFYPGSGETREVFQFLQAVYKRVSNFFPEREINYEDLYFVISQVEDFLQEYANPVVLDFVTVLARELGFCTASGKKTMVSLAEKAGDYINNLIAYSLGPAKLKMDYLIFLQEILADERVANLNIFTLNHDLLLEKFFIEKKIKYHDGFVHEEDKEFLVWRPAFQQRDKQVNLLKLHGSINWYKFKAENRKRHQGYYFAAFDPAGFHLIDQAAFPVLGKTPLILTGRYNKMLEYNRSIYVDLHYNFYQLLPLSDILLISGYGFNDKGINSWLVDWLYSAREHRIILIHPEPENCLKQAGWGIKEHWYYWLEKGKVNIIPQAIEDFSWQDWARFILRERR